MATKSRGYSAEDIEILEDLSPILHRPGMYTDPANPNHALVEVIDNASDEGLAGFAKSISVVLHEDGSATVEDDGRGIPVDIHPKKKVPAVQVIFTTLHSGGKFRKTDKDAVYRIAGGLHGVGICVTNALSTRLEVEVTRDGAVHRLVFADNGTVKEPLKKLRAAGPRESGTRIRFWPDPQYFDTPKIIHQDIALLLRAKAMLLPGVRFSLGLLEKAGRIETTTWHFPEGIKGYFASAISGNDPVAETFFGERYVTAQSESDNFAEGEGALWAIAWTAESEVVAEAYVNMIPTRLGGTHVSGLREGVYNAIRNFIELHAMSQRGLKLVPEDVWSRASYVLSVKMLDPQFKGQVKNELISRDAVKLVAQMVRDPFELWLNQHVGEGKRIAELVIRQALARSRAAQKVERRKSSGVAVLPGKLTDCASDDPERNELFIVEGDSAGGSAKQARDKEFQAVLPLKGKPKNTWQDDSGVLFANKEIEAIALAIGVEPHSAETADLSGLRYRKIVILADADVDGAHIQVLLLTLFFRHFPKLIDGGNVYVARPPLFRIDVPSAGKGKPARKIYALDAAELAAFEEKLVDEGVKPDSWAVSRFKGLGEMSPEQLWETTLNPDTRRMLPVSLGDSAAEPDRDVFNMMMSKENASQRREWMEAFGNLVDADIS